MSSFSAIRTALKVSLEDPVIEGLTAYDKIPAQMNYPSVVVHPEDADYTMAFQRGVVTYRFNLLVLVGATDSFARQDELDELVAPFGSKSIPKAIDSNRTLGLSDCDAVVLGIERYWVRYLSAHIGASLMCRVLSRGDG
jgi:hypothetical protein